MASNGERVHYSVEKHCGERSVSLNSKIAGAVSQKNSCLFVLVSLKSLKSKYHIPEEFLRIRAGSMLIASGVRALGWLKLQTE